jgi:hypothetical protein
MTTVCMSVMVEVCGGSMVGGVWLSGATPKRSAAGSLALLLAAMTALGLGL